MININDTIVAPVTNISTQAIALIRISGDDAFSIIDQLIDQKLTFNRGLYLRKIYDNQKLVDEVVVNIFTNPNSFTGENVVEIACHGGILNTNRILKLIISKGARLALKGEFSQRAFINGKIDLIQAEGINDLIHATNELALKIGVDNMSGINNNAIVDVKADLMDIISRIQVSIDYPDYDDVEGSTFEELAKLLNQISQKITNILKRSKLAFKNVEGIKTAIVGEPNVGKSSILNALLNEEKAIVTDIPGTTRDIVEGKISFENVTLNLIDTAGIRKTDDLVESLGIKKSLEYIKLADLVLLIVNPENINSIGNQKLFSSLKDKTYIIVMNKSETLSKDQQIEFMDKYKNVVFTSAINDDIHELIDLIQKKYNNEEIFQDEQLILININQISLIEKIKEKIDIAYDNMVSYLPIDIVNVDLYDAWNYINELIGEQYDEEIIDNIFRKYCLGK